MATDEEGRREAVKRLKRRQVLGLGSGLAFAGLAGCLGGSNGGGTDTDNAKTAGSTKTSASAGKTTGGTTTSTSSDMTSAGGTETSSSDETSAESTGTSSGDLADPTLNISLAWSYPPAKVNMNALTPAGNRPNPANVVWQENEAHWSQGPGKYVNFLLAENPTVDGCEVTYKYRDDYTWWDGTPVTAHDAVTAFKMRSYFNFDGPENRDTSYEAVDDHTVKQTTNAPSSKTLAQINYVNQIDIFKQDYWKSWIQKYEDASSKKKRDSITQDLTDKQITIQEMVDEGLGNGLYKPTNWDPTKVVNEKYDDHPYADKTNLKTVQWNIISDDQKFQQAFTANKLDLDRNPSRWQNKVNNPPKGIEILDTYGFLGGPKLNISWRNKHLARRGVRRALAYLMPSKSIQTVVKQGFGKPVEIPGKLCTGLVRSMEKKWLGEEFRNNVIDYGHTTETEKATQAMENAGYEKKNGKWVGPDGDAIKELRFVGPSWGPWPNAAETISEAFSNFGIPNNQSVPESGTWGKITNQTYNFDLNMQVEGTNDPFPSKYLRIDGQQGFGQYTDAVAKFPKTEGCSSKIKAPKLKNDTSPVFKHPLDPAPKFPKKVGQMDLSGKTQRFKPFLWVRGMEATSDTEKVKELARKCAWYHNFQALHIGVFNGAGGKWGDTANFDFPSKDDPTLSIGSAEYLLPKGSVNAKTK